MTVQLVGDVSECGAEVLSEPKLRVAAAVLLRKARGQGQRRNAEVNC